jgi:hypothetical protein
MAEALNAAYHLTGDFGAYPTCFPIPAPTGFQEMVIIDFHINMSLTLPSSITARLNPVLFVF